MSTADTPDPRTGRAPEGAPVSDAVLDTVLDPDTVVEQIQVGPPEPDPGAGSGPAPLRTVAGGRHEARERAVHLLYEAAIKGLAAPDVLAAQVIAPDPYAVELVQGVVQHQAALDEVIGRLARGWTLERMPTLDLVVLRVGTYELAHRPDVPAAVVLAEAVDLAGRYGTDDSSRFVNGLLAAAAGELRQD